MARMQETLQFARQRGVITLRSLLLLFTGGLLLLVLVAAVSVSFDRFRDYMTDQLRGHSQDGATAIGVSLSNAIEGRDPVAASSLIDAVFDSGRYLSVVYIDNQGEEIAGRETSLRELKVPGWFVSLADLPLPAGEAEVVRGWSRLGKVRVVSHPGRAYEDLWKVTSRTVAGSVLVAGVGLIGLFWTMTRLLRPLRAVEIQAQALGRRDFRRRVDITSTRELNQVTRAMNQMAADLGQLFEGQAKLVQHLRKVNNEDSVTGLASRRAFEQRLKVEVESEERAAPGVLCLIQLADFARYNQTYGREEADRLLVSIGDAIGLLREQPDAQLAMTLGVVSVASDGFRTDLLEQLAMAGPERQRLQVGVSEQAIHHHRVRVGLLVRALNRLQVPVIVDRFGVGGVPFSYLRNLRFQALRIDSSFIHNIDSHEDNRFYLESVATIARSRGVRVYVTGVETESEYSVLGDIGVDGAMGYHLGRPFEAGQ